MSDIDREIETTKLIKGKRGKEDSGNTMEIKEIPIDINGYFIIPREHRKKKTLNIKQSWISTTIRGRSIQTNFRYEENGDKPFVKEGIIEICHEKYQAKETDWANVLKIFG